MTSDEYLKKLQEVSEEEEGTDWKETGKHVLKHVVSAVPASIATAYLTGGGEAIPSGIIGGALSGVGTALATDEDDEGVVAPIGVGLGVGAAIGSKQVIDKQAKKIQEMKKQNYNYSDLNEFFSSYTKEGLEDFSNKLKNFAVLESVGAIRGYMAAPEGEDIEYATRGAFGSTIGGVAVGVPAAAAGTIGGGLLGGVFGEVPNKYEKPKDVDVKKGQIGKALEKAFENVPDNHKNYLLVKGANLKSRIGNTVAGAIFGGASAGLLGATLGSKKVTDINIKNLNERRRREKLAKDLMISTLTDEEKAQIGRLIRERRKEKGLMVAEDYINRINSYSFSDEDNSESVDNFAISKPLTYLIKAPIDLIKDGGKFVVKHPIVSVAGVGTGGAYVASNMSKNNTSENPTLKVVNEMLNSEEGTKITSLLGGALIGSAVYNSDPMIGAGAGAALGRLGHHIAGTGAFGDDFKNDSSAKLAVGIGTSALGSYLLSKLISAEDKKEKKKKKTISLAEPKVKGPGRPKKDDELEKELSQEDLKAFETVFK